MTGPTPPGRTPAYVRAGEQVVWFGKPTLRSAVSVLFGLVFTLLVFVLPGILAASSGGAGAVLPLLLLLPLILGVVALLVILRIQRTEFVITRTGVYTRSGIVGTVVAQTTFDKITDLEVRQDVWGRVFGYGALQVNTAGSNQAALQMFGLPKPLEAKAIIERTKDEYLARRRPGSTLPVFTPQDQVVNFTCPNCRAPLPRPHADVGKRAKCPKCRKIVRIGGSPRAARPR